MLETKSAGGVVLNAEGKILIVSQFGTLWSLPKGRVQNNEDLMATAEREIYEEAGIQDLKYVKELGTYQRYRLNENMVEEKDKIKIITMFLFTTEKKFRGMLHLIFAGTGKDKDIVLRMVETVPGGEKYLVPKYTTRQRRGDDGVETRCVDKLPEGCLVYGFFGNQYGVNTAEVIEQLSRVGVGFITISDIEKAATLKWLVEIAGFEVKMVYLHQSLPNLSSYPVSEQPARLDHYQTLLKLYQERLILDGLALTPVNGETSLASWVQLRLFEALQN